MCSPSCLPVLGLCVWLTVLSGEGWARSAGGERVWRGGQSVPCPVSSFLSPLPQFPSPSVLTLLSGEDAWLGCLCAGSLFSGGRAFSAGEVVETTPTELGFSAVSLDGHSASFCFFPSWVYKGRSQMQSEVIKHLNPALGKLCNAVRMLQQKCV